MLLFEIFQDVPDPRTPHPWLKHSLMDVLCIGLCAGLIAWSLMA
jgi:hypothetical protein